MISPEISLGEMRNAHQKTSNILHKTPILTSENIDKIVGAHVFFKCEHLQKTGSFKARGALNSAILAKEKFAADGVIAHSSGNHGQALAWAAREIGLKCSLVVPKNAPASKSAAMFEYGADVVYCEPTATAREQTCQKLAKELGFYNVEPFNCASMINGHASLGFEILDQIGDKIDSIFLSVGGGGMASSIAFCIGNLRPDINIYLVEPEQKKLNDLLSNDVICPVDTLNTIADGVRVARIGSLCQPILKQFCNHKVISVSENEIREAVKLIWTRLKQRVEPTAALAFAGIAFHRPAHVKNAAVILCGGNVDIDFIP
ncbi:unnamed protein product [Caenorhabditis angaria]|uniref:Serine racemase n=1 Tax=Caenorhabditis angaria TaxID=860376 RepID=A0A9P1I6Q4_9PELO|nr:unnamed protein product [Caenorhabditis angaria]